MKHETFFRKHPVFTSAEFTIHLAGLGKTGPRTRESLLRYHKSTGHIIRIRQGLFAVIPKGEDPDAYPVDPFLVTAKLTKDSTLSYHTALEAHGYGYSLRDHLIYSAVRPVSPVRFRSYVMKGVRVPVPLVRAKKMDVGVTTIERAGLEIKVTSLERTFVDMLDRPALSGSWEEIYRSLEAIAFFDLDKVVEYALLLGNATTIAKVGYYLEQHRALLMVEERHLTPLREQRPRQPHYLDSSARTSGKLVSDWNLVIPYELLNRTWEEVI
ncbi:MAG: transcriptional regulator [Deltaproteobacteria bacterium]|nr:MAG: transcriptional regulator [Deltaproteobacteria bacterium]